MNDAPHNDQEQYQDQHPVQDNNPPPQNGQPQQPQQSPATPISKKSRKGLLLAITIVILIAAIGYGIYWFIFGRHYESTDDAYVGGNVVQITPQIAGTVLGINADDTDLVEAGRPLIILDKADATLSLQQAEASLAQTVRQVRTVFVKNNTLDADVAARNVEINKASADLARRQQLISTGAISKEELDHARVSLEAAQAALRSSLEQRATNLALTSDTSIKTNPDVLHAAAMVRVAYLNLSRSTLPAPVAGYIAKRSVQIGQRVTAGAPLMSIVPLNDLWVDANFKEVQINHMRIGQPVTLDADIYGSGVEYHGTVVGLAAGTGSAFSLLPAQNAAGNWIKVVQRIPVRIKIDPKDLQDHPLRIGVSMNVKVDIARDDGNSLTGSTGVRSEPVYTTAVFETANEDADKRIADIISANDGGVNATAGGVKHVSKK